MWEEYFILNVDLKNKLKAIDFFCGAGGLTYGLRSAGIQVIVGIDNDSSCKETYEVNNPETKFLQKDIKEYSAEDLVQDADIKPNDDSLIFAGCSPCQFWSKMNTNKEKSKMTKDLILDFQEFVEYFKPGFVIVENVPGISTKEGSPMKKFINGLKKMGYHVERGVTDMSRYGVPQKRKRFTLLASRVSSITLPEPVNGKITVRDFIGTENGFKKIDAGHKDNSEFLHTSASLSEKNLKRLRNTSSDGGDRSDWDSDPSLQVPCYAPGEKKFYDTYGRMWWDRPAPTITTKFLTISCGRFAHPEENRAISLREGATLQTFPKKYKFANSNMGAIAKMIGNAVPPAFAEKIGEQIISSVGDKHV